jgi:hypothetical protein
MLELRLVLLGIGRYASQMAEHHEADGIGEARAWRFIETQAGRVVSEHDTEAAPTADVEQLLAILEAVRRRLHSRMEPVVVERWLNEIRADEAPAAS